MPIRTFSVVENLFGFDAGIGARAGFVEDCLEPFEDDFGRFGRAEAIERNTAGMVVEVVVQFVDEVLARLDGAVVLGIGENDEIVLFIKLYQMIGDADVLPQLGGRYGLFVIEHRKRRVEFVALVGVIGFFNEHFDSVYDVHAAPLHNDR